DRLEQFIDQGDGDQCSRWLNDHNASDVIHDVSQLGDAQRARLLELLPCEEAAELIEQIPMTQAVGGIESIDTIKAAEILGQLHSDDQADLVAELDDKDAHRIIGHLDQESADNLRRLSAYDPESAGGLMVTEFLAYPRDVTIKSVLDDLEQNA
ncbi:unnamed protein product, partial [Laminaria digitata]